MIILSAINVFCNMQHQNTFAQRKMSREGHTFYFSIAMTGKHLTQLPFKDLSSSFLWREITPHLGCPSSLINWVIKWILLQSTWESGLIANVCQGSRALILSDTNVILNQNQTSLQQPHLTRVTPTFTS